MTATNGPVTDFIPLVPDDSPLEDSHYSQPRFASWEKALLALITGVIAFGGATGNVWVAFPAAVVMVAVLYGLAALPDRNYVGEEANRRAGLVLGVVWAAITLLAALALFLVPASYTLTGGIVTALVSAGCLWGAIAYVDRPKSPASYAS
ncbi:hypothetical protein [Corynebacterium sp. HMSC29G08]|uniref:hypothetical protein n=1 Tax=Corynebacterium sp. HMSC29G08 TaxID=1581069 RepID=UPI0008A42452|nr:hypothetical protein [Corynebacterium sp. HMSC29G08]OFT81824.1 hypothetical protein HMPREF3101_09110 [Corynebacterium sp. HMSC29G08]